ncbi:UTP--glucose-1-phosphate uridylyltransferase, partial [Mesorhizobium sp. M6A.T.Ca.TU.002.02.2.1]
PVVQYAVDEAFEAGIEHIVFVTGRNKAVIEDYFDLHPELIGTLEQTGKKAQLQALESLLPVAGATSFIRQQSPQGIGHAVWCAREVIGDEPFALLLPDMVSFGGRGCLAEIADLYAQTGGNVIAVERCDPTETSKYGIVGCGADVGSGFEVTAMVEKPAPANAPSNYYINGRYILQPEIFALLGNQQRGAGNEIQLTDAMVRLAQSQAFFAQPFNGRMFDCGSKEGFIQANVAFALARDDMKGPIFEMLQEFVRSHERRVEAA